MNKSSLEVECKKFATDVVRREMAQIAMYKDKIDDVSNIAKLGETARQFFMAMNAKKPQEK